MNLTLLECIFKKKICIADVHYDMRVAYSCAMAIFTYFKSDCHVDVCDSDRVHVSLGAR